MFDKNFNLVIVNFEKGNNDGKLIGKISSDHGAWVTPSDTIEHVVQTLKPNKNYLVKIVGESINGNLRFCKVLLDIHDVFMMMLNGNGILNDNIEIYPYNKEHAFVRLPLLDEVVIFTVSIDGEKIKKISIKVKKGETLWEITSPNEVDGDYVISDFLNRKINQLRNKLEQKQSTKQNDLIKSYQELLQLARTQPNHPKFKPLQSYIDQAIKYGSSAFIPNKIMREFKKLDDLSPACLSDLIKTLTGGHVERSFYYQNNIGGDFLQTVEMENAKICFLINNAKADLNEDDPDFWYKACQKFGKFVCRAINDEIGNFLYYDMYTIKVGDITLIKKFPAGFDHDKEPVYV